MQYRRIVIPGASYFFTLALKDRRSRLLVQKINVLREAFHCVHQSYPFKINGIVILPEHLHILMTLPAYDKNYSQRINFIKSAFSRQIEKSAFTQNAIQKKRERGIWQRRFWEHCIRDESDYNNHLNYIHYNPVKHDYVQTPKQWQFSSIHGYIRRGILPENWGSGEKEIQDGKISYGE